MQMKISYNIKSADGKSLRNDFYATINEVPNAAKTKPEIPNSKSVPSK